MCNELRATQNKCIRFCLKPEDRNSITPSDFKKTNWLSVHERVNQYTLSSICKFHAKTTPTYMDELSSHAEYLSLTLSLPRLKANQSLNTLSYIGPSLWNNLDNSLKAFIIILYYIILFYIILYYIILCYIILYYIILYIILYYIVLY